MKARLFLIVAMAILGASCTQQSCPTYGSSYVYTPPKQKLFKARKSSGKKGSGKKTVKKAESD